MRSHGPARRAAMSSLIPLIVAICPLFLCGGGCPPGAVSDAPTSSECGLFGPTCFRLGAVSGRIREFEGQEVAVALRRLGDELVDRVLANVETGEYGFGEVAAGQYKLRVESESISAEVTIEVRPNQRTQIDWTFEPEELGSDGTVRPATFVAGDPVFVDLP